MEKWDEIPIIDLYSDGGAEPNPGNGGYGIILLWKGKRKEFSQGYVLTTNNRMELLGVISGLEKLKISYDIDSNDFYKREDYYKLHPDKKRKI